MNIKELAEKAKLDADVYTWNQIQLERFAELIRADEREQQHRHYEKAISLAIDTEREECARVCSSTAWGETADWDTAIRCADAIRSRK